MLEHRYSVVGFVQTDNFLETSGAFLAGWTREPDLIRRWRAGDEDDIATVRRYRELCSVAGSAGRRTSNQHVLGRRS
jgi:hypothetical protein